MLNQLKAHLSAEQIERIAASAQNVLALTLSPAPDSLPPTSSRVGGIGYWPQQRDYPRNCRGQPLALLAQFNLAELPPHPALPAAGLLAFYIDPFDDGLGMDDDNPNNRRNIATVYFADTAAASLSRAEQRALFPENAFYEDTDKNSEPETLADPEFQARWAADPQAEIRRWLAHKAAVAAKVADAELSRYWQQEEAAVLAALPALVDEIEQAEVNDISAISAVVSPWLAQSEARVMARAFDLLSAGKQDSTLLDWHLHDTAVYMDGEPVAASSAWEQTDETFQTDWQHHPEALIQGWAARKNHLVKAINHVGLNEAWQAEHSAILSNIKARIASLNKLAPLRNAVQLGQALAALCPRSEAAIIELMGQSPYVDLWTLSDELDDATVLDAIADLRNQLQWQSYWRSHPQAVLAVDWQMQDELVAAFGDARLSQTWARERAQMQAAADTLIAQGAIFEQAEQLDALLAMAMPGTVAAMQAAISADAALLARITELEYTMLGGRIARLAAHFQAAGLTVDKSAAMPANIAPSREQLLQVRDLFGIYADTDSADDANEAETAQAILHTFIADNDRQITALNDAELSTLWSSERAVLLAQIAGIRSRADALMFIGNPSASDQRLYALLQEMNPAKTACCHQLLPEMHTHADDEYAPYWGHPVSGEYAVSGSLQTQYLLHDSVEFAQYHGAPLYEWAQQQGLSDEAIEAIETIINRQQSSNHLMGYPFFTQTDPRSYYAEKQADILLFQLDSAGHGNDVDIMWGDSGVGAFFINAEDLANGHFERSWFNWDCY